MTYLQDVKSLQSLLRCSASRVAGRCKWQMLKVAGSSLMEMWMPSLSLRTSHFKDMALTRVHVPCIPAVARIPALICNATVARGIVGVDLGEQSECEPYDAWSIDTLCI